MDNLSRDRRSCDDAELFDAESFDREIVTTTSPLPLFRNALQQGNTVLHERFLAGCAVTTLVNQRAKLIDALLSRAWLHVIGENMSELALIAVGGYGRGELHPGSDIDIMLLFGKVEPEAYQPQIEALLMLLWDIGLEVGQSVRTLEDCEREAEADITVATNLMEARQICGPEALFSEMRTRVGPDRLWPGRSFFEAKWREQQQRHHKFNDTAYNLEPNIKEGPGGLRDIQMIGWVAKRHYSVDTLGELVDHGFLTQDEYRDLAEGQAFLWKIRFGLHDLTGRREDRLLFDHQRTLAQMFGYRDEDGKLAVEHFMKVYYRTVMELERLNEMLLQLFQEQILLADDSAEPLPINKRFQSRKGFIEVTHERTFETYPFALLEIFLILAQHPDTGFWYEDGKLTHEQHDDDQDALKLRGVSAATIRLIRHNRYRIDENFRHDLRCRSLFMELLRQPQGVTHELHRMNRYGILAEYIPAFGQIVGQMQHDLFHVYTVDEHILFVIRNLRRFTVPKFEPEFPLCSKIINHLPKSELLYIAGLFHDIAKGRGGDHSKLGAVDVEQFCQQHDISEYDTRLVSWLVRSHLIMSTTAQRQDISDPEVINDFAALVGNTNRLDYLYLLTVADIRATSPSVWNSWKDSLLAELYHSTRHALRRGLGNPIEQREVIDETKDEARTILSNNGLTESAINTIWDRVGDDYFLRYTAHEIAWHTEAISQHQRVDTPLILIQQEVERGGTEIFIYMPIMAHQFTSTTATLDQLGLNILDARIISTSDDYTLDTYMVLEQDGQPISSSQRIHEIEDALNLYLIHPEQQPGRVYRQVTRQQKQFDIPIQIRFYPDQYQPRTIMEVVASDRPGMLSQIARALANCNVQLQNARITTLGERVEDIFYITDAENGAIEDESQTARLRETVIDLIENH
ncbi:[protein-PII] uridylyltransferase [Solemya pervernicosa gill symbiont]|uniref:Bifunctional uridylyltransferase/uridylyl-removing enzyme n=2 Tax=Gammaproteobacteria incertae sedis TaxID=118884 RepID=A0A1T2L7U2_9GAMM|nr:[protein-PII] uridylyltransferase [Candidatus Reidiella endopervernicosa]OOZ41178.1 [protein-PII] uridylyltransferase [Solemya pervernicosa gill symbiont]QKQ27097.1 [protein-PII] uridylyltransferase [Candidatus Reidiella endopervernicosa]